VDQLGPGPAYDRWRNTPAYQDWLRETGQAPVLAAGVADRLRALIDGDRWDQTRALLAQAGGPQQEAALLEIAAGALCTRVPALRRQGKPGQAQPAERLARACCERLLVLRPDNAPVAAQLAGLLMPGADSVAWEVLHPVQLTSAEGATLTRLPDGAILAGGNSPDHDSYTVTARTRLPRVTAVRLETLPHPSLPGGCAGRDRASGNFHLSEVQLNAGPGGEREEGKRVAFADAWADFASLGNGIEQAIDGDQATRWNVNPRQAEPHTAILELQKAVQHRGPTTLTIRLDCRCPTGKQATLGCFRLAVTAGPSPVRAEHWRQGYTQTEVSAWTWLAAAYFGKGEDRAALDALESRAVRTAPGLLLRALVYQRQGRHKEARASYEQGLRALAAQPAQAIADRLAREAMHQVAGLNGPDVVRRFRRIEEQREELALSATVEREPGTASAWTNRGIWYAVQGRWKEAAADLTRAGRLNPEDNWLAFQAATLLARTDRTAHREHCKQMLTRFGDTRTATIAERTAKSLLVLPASGADLRRAAALARRAEEVGQGQKYQGYFEATLALAEYRLDRWPAAQKHARKVLTIKDAPWAMLVPARAVLAMSLHRQGKTAEARKELAQAAELFEKEAPTVDREPVQWQDWIVCRILLDEAQGCLSRPAKKPKEAKLPEPSVEQDTGKEERHGKGE
jgi:tetratricopeptide (TPR) repeat protein